MPLDNFIKDLDKELRDIDTAGTTKREEQIVVKVKKSEGKSGPRFFLSGHGEKEFIRMNANSYLGMALREKIVEAEEKGARDFGVGPGAVRFISGTYEPHRALENRLAKFHGREDCMLNSSAYTSVVGLIATLTTPETIIISDELNHNCIINGMRLARPKDKKIYKHNDMGQLEQRLTESIGRAENLIVISDGVFSMRGDIAPLDKISELTAHYSPNFARDIILVVDDSHGVGALGETGRGTEQYTGAKGVDILVATLGKAFGVNGGYIVSKATVINYLREKNPFYIYTNPITPSEATAARAAVDLLDSGEGRALLEHLRAMTRRFEDGLVKAGFETIPSEHPVVPLLVRDTAKTVDMVKYLRENGVLATGLSYPVVPKGDETIRFQVCADHTADDIDQVLDILGNYEK